MLSKNKIKEIKSLEQKKFRKRSGLFVAEGPKLVLDLMKGLQPQYVIATHEWLLQNASTLPLGVEVEAVNPEELQRCSLQQHPQDMLCLFRMPDYKAELNTEAEKGLVLALDGVQDPGNLGTIVRLADWFGISHVFCSLLCADIYNPKCVQATMGAMARVKVIYTDLPTALADYKGKIYGTFLDGKDIYATEELSDTGVIVMGNEGSGISEQVAALVNARLYIPPFPTNAQTSESLNVAVATAITCAEFRRRQRN